MRTLFLNPPAYENFDGGAGSRYQATREVWSFWYPTWLCYPAGMIKDSRVLDAPPEKLNQVQTVAIAKEYDFVVLHTSTPSFKMDVRTAEMIKAENPQLCYCFCWWSRDCHARPNPEGFASDRYRGTKRVRLLNEGSSRRMGLGENSRH